MKFLDPVPLINRIQKRIGFNPETGCSEWYGVKLHYKLPITIQGKTYDAKTLAWRLAGNTVPSGFVIRETCTAGHLQCVNPDHMECVPRRYRHKNSRLTAEQINEIADLVEIKMSYRTIAKRYDVSRQTVLNVAKQRIKRLG